MAKAELKTKKNNSDVSAFIAKISPEQKRRDCMTLVELMEKGSKAKPKMWGDSIIGFGDYHYKYESGREGDWFLMGFSPRKQAISLYFFIALEKEKKLLEKLGRHKTGKACIYINQLADIDVAVLKEIISKVAASVRS